MKFLPNSDAERRDMLAAIGASSIDDLFATVPAAVRQAPDLPDPLSEIEIRRFLGGLASKNANARDTAFFLGGGVYNHYVSAIADQMLYRAEWLTAYTPYQPEVSQGTLQSIFEFQTHVCLLTGLEVANASLYEGASALVEALLMAERLSKGRKRAVLSAGIHPEYRETVRSYFANLGLEIVEVPLDAAGATDPRALEAAVDATTFAVAVQSPNFYGVIEDWAVGSRGGEESGRARRSRWSPRRPPSRCSSRPEREAPTSPAGSCSRWACRCTWAGRCSVSSPAASSTSGRFPGGWSGRRSTPKGGGHSA